MYEPCINVPNDSITPGCTPSKVEKGIQSNHLSEWNSRDNAELVILLDWNSAFKRLSDLSDPLRSLHDCIWKWDQEKVLRRRPVILEGGYTEWLESYPQFTSNPRVKPPSSKPNAANLNSLLDFSYDDLKSVLRGPEKPASPTETKLPVSSPVLQINGTKQPEVSVAPTPTPKVSKTQPKESTKRAENDSLKNDRTSVYPTLPAVGTSSKADGGASSATSGTKLDVKKKTQPSIDRSNKPNLSAAKDNQAELSSTLPSELSGVAADSTVSKEDREPELPTNAGTMLISPDPISDIEKRIALRAKEQKQKEKDLANLLEQKRLAELQAIEEQQNKKEKELEIQKRKAERDLAMAMRSFAKPDKINGRLNREETPVSSSIGNAKTNLTPRAESAKQPVGQTLPFCTAAKSDDTGVKNQHTTVPGPVVTSSASDVIEHISAKSVPSSSAQINSTSATETDRKLTPNRIPGSSEAASVSRKNVPIDVMKNDPRAVPPKPPTVSSEPPAADPLVSPRNSATTQKPLLTMKETIGSATKETNSVAQERKLVDRFNKPIVSSASDTSVQTPMPRPDPTTANKPTPDPAKPKPKPPQQSFGGLKRSSSSPNIAKMVQNEKAVAKGPIIPNRAAKPAFSQEPSPYESALSRSLQGVYGGPGNALCGLRNLGNSCYMNSTLQCLFNTTQLVKYILEYSYRRDINRLNRISSRGKVAEGFAVLLRAVWTAQYRYLIPREFKKIVGEIKPMFARTTQEDSHEFLMCLLDELHEDLNKAANTKYEEEPDNDRLTDDQAATQAWKFHKRRNESVIVELFSGQFKATVQCLACGKTSRKFDTFMYLSLPLPKRSASIDDVIKSFTENEKMTGTDRWECPNCKVLRDAVRSIQIWKLPPVLIVHFKRFVHTGRWLDKIHTDITYPISGLNLQNFTRGPHKRKPYDLFAVSHHSGPGLDSGHYTATCKSAVDDCWYKYDDTEVNRSYPPKGATSFILFYSSIARKAPV